MNCPTCQIEMTAGPAGPQGGIVFRCLKCGGEQAPQLPAKRFKCADCQAELEVAPPEYSVAGNGEMTAIVVLHPKPVACQCGAIYLDTVDFEQTRIATKPRQVAKGESRILLPGDNSKAKVM